MASSPLVATLSWIFLAGGVLLQYFVILGGGVDGNPEPLFWFIKADTSGMGNAAPYTAWTFFATCAIDAASNKYGDCSGAKPALPFSPGQNFGAADNTIPPDFVGNHHYYYLSRFMFAFYIIALFFSNISLLTGFVGLCTRIGSYLTSALVSLAVFFQAITAALMTACFVQGRDAFRRFGRDAVLGRYNFAFTWTSFVCFFISMVLFCGAGVLGGRSSGGGSRFSRKRSTRSRGSFRDAESGGVKDEYS